MRVATPTPKLSVRSTSATGVHNASSRSHAILRVFTFPKPEDGAAQKWPPPEEGVLTLVRD